MYERREESCEMKRARVGSVTLYRGERNSIGSIMNRIGVISVSMIMIIGEVCRREEVMRIEGVREIKIIMMVGIINHVINEISKKCWEYMR
uniref:Succinate dehydrogenase cytochrome B560 subunit n=1 Tax=Galdieria sulphuraria TaxID=130081 RepID=A0A075W0B9_GALSU|nr:succinate dehydrogenase cytochrome B560 subunit [Galdieria sulphuraria]AIG92656.1 succinate dehydrogenase cytochrome B560 subunit [Galdieria sulphuraria]